MKTKLERPDLLELKLAMSEVQRLAAQHQALTMQLDQVTQAHTKAQAEHQAVAARMRAEYGLSETDRVHLDTGEIQRAPKARPEKKVRASAPAVKPAKNGKPESRAVEAQA